MNDLIREIEEELQAEKFQKLWGKFGGYIMGVIATIVIGVSGFQGYSYYANMEAEKAGAQFAAAQALLDSDKPKAIGQLEELSGKSGGYAMLAKVLLAENEVKAGNLEAASEHFKGAVDKSELKEFKAIIAVRHIEAYLASEKYEAAEKILEEYKKSDLLSEWQILDYQAIISLGQGDEKQAAELFGKLAALKEVPDSVRTRAAQLARSYKAIPR
jgi:hypothetical protein